MSSAADKSKSLKHSLPILNPIGLYSLYIKIKIFLNMVIHDLRNPTNNIEYALREVIKVLKLDG